MGRGGREVERTQSNGRTTGFSESRVALFAVAVARCFVRLMES